MDSQTSRVVLGCGEETQLVLRKAGVFVRVIRPAYSLGADVTLEVTTWSEERNWTADREAIARLANEALAALDGAECALPALEAVTMLVDRVLKSVRMREVKAVSIVDTLRNARLQRLDALLALEDDPPADLVAATQGSVVLAVNALRWLRLRLVDHSPYEPELYEKETQGLRERAARLAKLDKLLANPEPSRELSVLVGTRNPWTNAYGALTWFRRHFGVVLPVEEESDQREFEEAVRRRERLDELLASEEPPGELGHVIFDATYAACKIAAPPEVTAAAWRWLREQLGAPVEAKAVASPFELLQLGIFTTLSEDEQRAILNRATAALGQEKLEAEAPQQGGASGDRIYRAHATLRSPAGSIQERDAELRSDAAAKQRAAMDVLHADAALGRQLVTILSDHCGERGDSEGAVDTLQRIIRERESLRRAYGELVDIDLRHTTHQAILKTQNATLVAENQHLLGNLKELESASVRASRLASRNAALEAENKRLAQRLAERERPLTVPWFKGLSMEEINTQILIGKAPGSNVAGGVIPVPGGYLNWLGSGGAAKDRPENSALRERLAALEKLADGVKEDLDQKYPLGSEPSEQPQGE